MNDRTDDVLSGSWTPSQDTDPEGDEEVVLTDAHFDRADFTPEHRAAIETEVAAMHQADTLYAERLADLRRALGCTQTDVAQRMGISQPAVAAIETPTDVRLSTLARYLDAIGGHGELVVAFPDHTRITIGLEQLVPNRS
jgi:DNA-binding XRE family transcriptional regulator